MDPGAVFGPEQVGADIFKFCPRAGIGIFITQVAEVFFVIHKHTSRMGNFDSYRHIIADAGRNDK